MVQASFLAAPLKILYKIFVRSQTASHWIARKNQTRSGAQFKTLKNFKIMTYVSNSSNDKNRRRKEYQIEVITFNGESEILYVVARTAEEAQAKAAAQVEEADYTMVQGSWEY